MNIATQRLAAALVAAVAASSSWANGQAATDNLRMTLDVASRGMWVTNTGDQANAWFLGLDLHKVFSNDVQDIGTLTLQPYVIRLNDVAMHPPFFKGPNDTAVEYRIVNFNLTAFGGGRSNIRIGHFEIPFGLEQVINTNGTLRDYLHGSNLGVKADWGLSLNGDLPRAEYEVALTRGSGNGWSNRGNPYIFSGRVGTSRAASVVAGLSFFSGRVTDVAQSDFTNRRKRVAADLQWHGPWVDVLAEYSLGTDESLKRRTALLEISSNNASGTLGGYVQIVHQQAEVAQLAGMSSASSANLGVIFTPDNHWSLSASWGRDLKNAGPMQMSMIAAQLRYRF